MATQLETSIPLKEASRKYGVPIEVLTRLVRDGIIRLARTEEGDSVINVSAVDGETATHIYDVDVVSLSGRVDRDYF